MENILLDIFILLIFGSFIFTIAESIGTSTFVRFFYKIGITLIKKTVILEKPLISRKLDDSIYMDEGKFQFKDDNKIYFVTRDWGISRFFRFSTPFPIKGIADIDGEKNIKIYGKLPLGTTIITLLFLIPIILINLSNKNNIMSYLFGNVIK